MRAQSRPHSALFHPFLFYKCTSSLCSCRPDCLEMATVYIPSYKLQRPPDAEYEEIQMETIITWRLTKF